MTNIPLWIYQIINLVNAISSILIGVFVLLVKPPSRQTILFAAFAFCVSFWAFFFFLAYQTENYLLSSFLFRTCMIGAVCILPMFTEFVYAFVGKEIKLAFRVLNWGVAGLIIASIYTNVYAYDGGPFLAFHYWPVIGVMSLVEIFQYAINLGFAFKELFLHLRNGPSHQRQQAKIILAGTFIGFMGGAANFLLWFRIPFPPILNALIPIYIISVAYAILRHQLMEIEIVIKKGTIYSILTACLTGLFLSIIKLGEFFFSGISGYSSLWTTILAIFTISIIFQPLRDQLQVLVDKFFFKTKYDYRQTLKELSQKASATDDLDQLLTDTTRSIQQALKCSALSVYLWEGKAELYKKKCYN